MSNYAADDYDAIYDRLKSIRGTCPTAAALGIGTDIQYYATTDTSSVPTWTYRAVSERAVPFFQQLYVEPSGWARWQGVDPTGFRSRLNVPEDFIFEEVPKP